MAVQGKRPGASLAGPLYLRKTPLAEHRGDADPHVSALWPVTWYNVADMTKNSTDLELSMAENETCELLRMPFDGSIVAISACMDTKLPTAASVVAVQPKISGVSQTGTLRPTIVTGQRTTYAAVTNLTSYSFTAGDTVGVLLQTSNNTLNTAENIAVTLWFT